jgi:hypothetical protein
MRAVMLSRCSADGCGVYTIGPLCVEHDVPVTRTFTRGRPFVLPQKRALRPLGLGPAAVVGSRPAADTAAARVAAVR